MSRIKKSWNIHPDWIKAHDFYADEDCPMIVLEHPFHVGPSVRIGGLGFGYDRRTLKVKSHKYGVVVKAGASLHSGVVIDRGQNRDTTVGPNARLNALTFVGHDVQIGRALIMGVKSSVSGSTTIGDYVQIWSHAYIEQSCEIGDRAIVGAFSHVRDRTKISEGEVWFGNPAKFQRMRRDDE